MSENLQLVKENIGILIDEWLEKDILNDHDLFVVGCSTSEVAGEHIGTSGSELIAKEIYDEVLRLTYEKNIRLVFQCCEHLNRALVIERKTLIDERLTEVNAVPVRTAGGAMATYAYQQMDDPVLVEFIQADAGIDIGDTLIGMQLKHVAVPVRFNQKMVGVARVTGARTRAKLIGGERATYSKKNNIN